MNSNKHSPQYIELMDAIVSYKNWNTPAAENPQWKNVR